MDELLRKLAIEGWWVWALALVVVTIAYLARHRVGLAALVKGWEPWEGAGAGADELKPLLADGEEVAHVDGPVAETSRRVLVRKRARGFAFAQGDLASVVNIEYGETWLPPVLFFGALYVVLGALAVLLRGGAAARIVLGVLIAAAGLAILLPPLLTRPAVLTITFASGRPIIVTGRWEQSRLLELARVVTGGAAGRER